VVLLLTSLIVVSSLGLNGLLWGLTGCVRGLLERWTVTSSTGPAPSLDDVAVLIAAHNEAAVIERTLSVAARQVPIRRIHVVSDGSSDETAFLARHLGAQVLQLPESRGKGGALVAGLEQFKLCDRFQILIILDADTELSDDYVETGLRLFAQPEVAAVAGMIHTVRRTKDLSALGRMLMAYRERVYLLAQYVVKFGQAWADVVFVASGCASLYRTEALRHLQLNVPGLVVEDVNMTFTMHRKHLGRVAFHPRAAVAYTQDPTNLSDYRHQVGRWALGYWQSVFRSRWHARKFDFTIGLFSVELLASCAIVFLTVLAASALLGTIVLNEMGAHLHFIGDHSAIRVVIGVFGADLVISAVVAVLQRRWGILLWAVTFPFIRVLDAWLALRAFVAAFTTQSTGRWISPRRRSADVVKVS
jgi:biofilm PGA synthesis N-glycosyltransferase PgaC